jgi:hypothetical protein
MKYYHHYGYYSDYRCIQIPKAKGNVAVLNVDDLLKWHRHKNAAHRP